MTSLKSGVYWRKSKFFARQCPPGILALEGETVSFTTTTGRVFRAAASEVEATFTGWGTLVLRVGGRTYDMIGSGGEMALEFSPHQIAELKQSTIDRGGAAGVAGDALAASGNAAAAVLGELITVGVATGKYASGVKILKQWPTVLSDAGARVTATKGNYMGWLYGALGAALVVMLVVGLVLQNR